MIFIFVSVRVLLVVFIELCAFPEQILVRFHLVDCSHPLRILRELKAKRFLLLVKQSNLERNNEKFARVYTSLI